MTEPESLVTAEGVAEGSADSTAEGPADSTAEGPADSTSEGPAGAAGVLGEPARDRPADGSQPAGPLDLETAQSRAERARKAPGQQLSAGEG